MRENTFQAVWLPVNQAWAILWGTSLIDIEGQYFFPTKDILRMALQERDLKLHDDNSITAAEELREFGYIREEES